MIAVPTQWNGRAEPSRWGSHDVGESALPRFCLLVGCGRRGAALQGALSSEGFSPTSVESLAAARGELRRRAADLLVVGEGIRDADPVRSLPALVEEGAGSPVLFLADRNDRDLAIRAMENGADDVVVPPHSVSAILLRYCLVGLRPGVRRPARPDTPPARVQLGALEVDLPGRRVLSDGRPVNLSGREVELLERLLHAGGEVVTRGALLEDIWGTEQGSEAVLDATVHRLRRKLEKDLSDPRLLTTVRGVGYRLEPEELVR